MRATLSREKESAMKEETLLEMMERLHAEHARHTDQCPFRVAFPRLRDAIRKMRVALVMEGHHELLARLDSPEKTS